MITQTTYPQHHQTLDPKLQTNLTQPVPTNEKYTAPALPYPTLSLPPLLPKLPQSVHDSPVPQIQTYTYTNRS